MIKELIIKILDLHLARGTKFSERLTSLDREELIQDCLEYSTEYSKKLHKKCPTLDEDTMRRVMFYPIDSFLRTSARHGKINEAN